MYILRYFLNLPQFLRCFCMFLCLHHILYLVHKVILQDQKHTDHNYYFLDMFYISFCSTFLIKHIDRQQFLYCFYCFLNMELQKKYLNRLNDFVFLLSQHLYVTKHIFPYLYKAIC